MPKRKYLCVAILFLCGLCSGCRMLGLPVCTAPESFNNDIEADTPYWLDSGGEATLHGLYCEASIIHPDTYFS